MPRRYETTDMGPFIILAALAAIVGAILLFVNVLPEKKRAGLNDFFKKVADIFNFKNLLLESILKFCYAVTTLFAIVFGFFTMFAKVYGDSLFLAGLLIMVAGPILIRIAYELSMMFILLVKNTIEIKKKLPLKEEVKEQKEQPAVTEKRCPVCNAVVDPNAAFCTTCGQKLN